MAFNEKCPSFINPAIPRLFEDAKICKTPAWAVAHGLERIPIARKLYRLYPATISELANAADNGYLIVGVLNKDKRIVELDEKNKNITLGPHMRYVLDDKKQKDGVSQHDIITCVLSMPSTSLYFFPQVPAKCDMIKSFMQANNDFSLSEFVLLEPLPAADLHITRDNGEPSKGGLLSSFKQVF